MLSLGKEVALKDINKELKSLFAGDTARTNACMMNFAIFTEDPSQLEENGKRISLITENQSCRALSIALDKDAETKSITSWVSAHCNMTNGKKTVCCEQLSFLLKGFVSGRLRNTVFANLNSDLPLVFWWQGELTVGFEPRLYTIIDRFIFDSEEWANPKECYHRLLDASNDVKRRFITQDLAWTRSYYVRLAFASIFDEPCAQKEYPNIDTLTVRVGNGYKNTGSLLLAWIARQAGWTLIEKNKDSFVFQNQEGNQINASLTLEGSIPIAEVSVKSAQASFTILHEENYLRQIITNESGTHQMLASSGKLDQVSLVLDQLSRGGKNSLLQKTIPLFLELL